MAAQDPFTRGRTRTGLDANERRPDGDLKPTAQRHPEDFTRNTGAGGAIADDRPEDDAIPANPDAAIVPTDSPGG